MTSMYEDLSYHYNSRLTIKLPDFSSCQSDLRYRHAHVETADEVERLLTHLQISEIESQLPNHPLLEPFLLILENVFGHLGPADLRSCRLVSQQWNQQVLQTVTWEFPIKLKKTSQITSFLKVIDDPNSQFPAHHLEVYEIGKIDVPEMNILIHNIGHSIKTLILDSVEFYTYPLLNLVISCPQLELLSLQFTVDDKIEVAIVTNHNMLQDASQNQFPSLKTLLLDFDDCCISSNDLLNDMIDQAVGNLVMFLLDSAPHIIAFGLCSTKNVVMDILSTGLVTRPHILKRLEVMLLEGVLKIEHWFGMKFSLKTLMISILDESISTESFSWILEANSGTLNTLQVIAEDGCEFQLHFPCEMNRLERVFVVGDILVHGGSISLLKRLPKLLMFIHFKEEGPPHVMSKFWHTAFYDEDREAGVVNKSLTTFFSPIYVDDEVIFHKITTAFPGLRVLQLHIDGTLLRELIHGMKDLQLQKLAISFFESQGGILAFDSALTGISEQDCQKLLQNESYDEQDVEKLRVNSSLADWKYLEHLKIQFIGQNKGLAALDRVAVFQGILRATSLNLLVLNGFEAEQTLVLKMLNGLSLNTFGITKIRFPADGQSDICDLQGEFPDVEFLSL